MPSRNLTRPAFPPRSAGAAPSRWLWCFYRDDVALGDKFWPNYHNPSVVQSKKPEYNQSSNDKVPFYESCLMYRICCLPSPARATTDPGGSSCRFVSLTFFFPLRESVGWLISWLVVAGPFVVLVYGSVVEFNLVHVLMFGNLFFPIY